MPKASKRKQVMGKVSNKEAEKKVLEDEWDGWWVNYSLTDPDRKQRPSYADTCEARQTMMQLIEEDGLNLFRFWDEIQDQMKWLHCTGANNECHRCRDSQTVSVTFFETTTLDEVRDVFTNQKNWCYRCNEFIPFVINDNKVTFVF